MRGMVRTLALFSLIGACSGWQQARDTVGVEFTMTALDSPNPQVLRQGDMVNVQFAIRDKASGSLLSGKYPSAWIDSRGTADAAHAVSCRQRVQRLLNADVFSRPDVDLNSYYVMAMNDDASLTVVDPEFGYGNTKLLAIVPLRSPGADWALTATRHPALFIAMPAAARVAVVDTDIWRVVREIDTPGATGRVALQPDGKYLWVATDSGVLAIDTGSFLIAARLPTGAGPHTFAFTPESRSVFVTNESEGSVSIVDAGSLAVRAQVRTGPRPVAVAYSRQSQRAYAIDSVSGDISIIDGESGRATASLHVAPGVGAIRFAREGRFGFILDRAGKRISILDSSTNRVIQSTPIDHEPDQIAFSDTVAYIRQTDNDAVLMIPLDAIGTEGKTIPVADFTGGQHPPGQAGSTTPADGIVRAPGENAVLIANPGDKAIYYYAEGMAAPMGFFSNYSLQPRAVLVLDRSLRQTAPGTYATTSHLPHPGLYTMAFLLDSPPAVQCWDFEVLPDPNQPENTRDRVDVESLNPETIPAGVPVSLRFLIRSRKTAEPKPNASDVIVQAYLMPGVNQQRKPARATASGIYEADFLFAKPGVYRVHLASPSFALNLQDYTLTLTATEGK